MPLPLRRVEPVHVSRGTLPERFPVQNDLEAVANGSLANVIVQLSSLSHHAEELFTDLIRVASDIAARANNLQARIDRLAVKTVQLDGMQEDCKEYAFQDTLNTKAFSSSNQLDQQVLRGDLPPAMSKTYASCDKPPPLDKLNVYRDDGKDGLKFYTDPSYFFDLWRQEMLKDTERVIRKHHSVDLHEPHKPKHEHGQRHKKRVRQPHNTRERQRHIAIEHGEHIMQGSEFNRPANVQTEVPDAVLYPPADPNDRQLSAPRPNSIELESKGYNSPYNEQPYGNGVDMNNYRQNHHINRSYSQSPYQYDMSAYEQNGDQQRYYAHMTPPSSYADLNSPNQSYSSTRAASTPRGSAAHAMTNGFGFRPSQPPPAPPPAFVGTPPSSQTGTPTRGARGMNSREALPPPPPPPAEMETQVNQHNGYHIMNHGYDRSSIMPPPPPEDEADEPLPPPPPTPDQEQQHHGMHHHHHAHHHGLRPPSIPEEQLPPSPPPPPPDVPAPPPPPLPLMHIPASTNGGLVKVEKKPVQQPQPQPVCNELLQAIRKGIALRKVDKKEPIKEDKQGAPYCDVASILARRVAVEMSDSDSGSDSEYDSDGWEEASA